MIHDRIQKLAPAFRVFHGKICPELFAGSSMSTMPSEPMSQEEEAP